MLRQGPHISLLSVNTAMWVNLITAFLSEYPQYTLSNSAIAPAQLEQHGLHTPHSFLLAYESDIPPFLAEESNFKINESKAVADKNCHSLFYVANNSHVFDKKNKYSKTS